jgi:hypothetical protein
VCSRLPVDVTDQNVILRPNWIWRAGAAEPITPNVDDPKTRSGIRKVRMVDDVKDFGAKLRMDLFGDLEVAHLRAKRAASHGVAHVCICATEKNFKVLVCKFN